MKFRRVLAVAASAAAVSAAVVAPASASQVRPMTPFASGVSIKLVTPSTLSNNGAYQVSISEISPSSSNCSFLLYRYTDSANTFQYLGSYSGTSTTDLVQNSFGNTIYRIYPKDCNNNQGSSVDSAGFTPTTVDNPFSVYSGSGTTAYNSKKYYGGSVLQTTSGRNTRVRWNTDRLYNVGIVIGTGPSGGIGTVYVDGQKKGTINFYSAKANGKLAVFKYGTASSAYHTVDVVATGSGSRGGYAMYLDAGTENRG